MAGRYATRQTQLYCCWQREVDTVAHQSTKWECGLREHTLSGILSLSFRAAIGLKEKVVTGELSVWCRTSLTCSTGSVGNCAHNLSTYGVCAGLNNSLRRRAAHVFDTDRAGAVGYSSFSALTRQQGVSSNRVRWKFHHVAGWAVATASN